MGVAFGNPVTTIPVAVLMTSKIKLVVYNILGREARIIYGGTLPAGRYWFTWEGKDEAGNPVATGVYLYRLSIKRFYKILKKVREFCVIVAYIMFVCNN
jgi:flagellar hook assembly protein FlgD